MKKLIGDRAFRIGLVAFFASFALAACGPSPAGGSPWVPFDDDATVLAPSAGREHREAEGHAEPLVSTASADCGSEHNDDGSPEPCLVRDDGPQADHAGPAKE